MTDASKPCPADAQPDQCMITRDVDGHAFVRGVRCTRDAGHPGPGTECHFEHVEARAREAVERGLAEAAADVAIDEDPIRTVARGASLVAPAVHSPVVIGEAARSSEALLRPDGCDCWGTSTCAACDPADTGRRPASAQPPSFSPADCGHDHESNVLTEACLACIREYAERCRASAQSGLDPEHCETCAAFVERNAPPAPKVEVKSELWDAAKLKMRQLEGEIQRCSATQREKSNMLHSFSKLCMFATDAWDMEVTRPANRRPSKAPPGLREAAEEVFAAFNTPGITDAQASSLVHLGAVLERRSEGAQSEPPWCKGCRAQRTTSSDGYCINCGTKEEPASVCAHGVTLASPCMTCIRYGADDPRGPDHGRPTPNAGKDGAK